jgi:hypothetical protein
MRITGARRKIETAAAIQERIPQVFGREVVPKVFGWAVRPGRCLRLCGYTDGAVWHPPAFWGMPEDTDRLAIPQVDMQCRAAGC